jgi:hypothetical protein
MTPVGGAPNLTHEPRKPRDLGTQLKNGIECLSGCMAFQGIVQLPELQRQKDLFEKDNNNLGELYNDEMSINLVQVKTSLPGELCFGKMNETNLTHNFKKISNR